eukprot:m.174893 g.174893  ORF g.174893 m.174893 type:complete len:910 (+) comp15329_c1_seq4:2068-4797(+)
MSVKFNAVAPMELIQPGESEVDDMNARAPIIPTRNSNEGPLPPTTPTKRSTSNTSLRPEVNIANIPSANEETSNPNQAGIKFSASLNSQVAWKVVDEAGETEDVGELPSKRPRSGGSFTYAPRRLTYDFTTLKVFATLPPTTRNKITVMIYFIAGIVLLITSLTAGIKMLGRPYDPYVHVSEPTNGRLPSVMSFMGIILLIYMGSGAIMLLANLLPSLVVINLPFPLVRALLIVSAIMSFIAMVLCMVYVVEAAETYDMSENVGTLDPMLASVGVFYFFGFSFLFFICMGILAHMFEFVSKFRKMLHSGAHSFKFRVWAFLLFCLASAFILSNFMCNPVAAGETWAGVYFRATSPYSLVNWVWSKNFIYKLFPDVLAYYLFIFTVVIVAYVAHKKPELSRWLHRRVWAPRGRWPQWLVLWHPFPYGISNGEVLLMAAFGGFIIFWVVYWRVVFDYTEKKLVEVSIFNVPTEIAARSMGHMTTLFAALALFPASRTGLWVDVFGVPYDRCIRYHRLMGAIALLFVTLHGMVWWVKWLEERHLGDNIFSIDHLWISPVRISYMDWSIPIAETAWFLMLMSVISAVLLRRKLYPVFQYSHKYIGTIFYVSILYHAWSFWYFAFGSLMLWFVDKISRGVRAAYLCLPKKVEWVARNNMVRIKLGPDSYKHYQPGQYFFINIPQLSINEWHPFTASAVMDDGIIFYIKAMPKNPALTRIPWTQRLSELVQTSEALPMLRLSGPFGHTDFEGYESLVMFAGGIGITPMIAIFTDLMHRAKEGRPIGRLQNVALVWMSRSVAEFRLFEEIFTMVHTASVLAEEKAHVNTQACNFHVRLHCTRRESWISMVSPESLDHVRMFVAQGRCDVAGRIEEFMTANPTDTMVAVCGPHTLTHTASKASWKFGTDFHAEQFSF